MKRVRGRLVAHWFEDATARRDFVQYAERRGRTTYKGETMVRVLTYILIREVDSTYEPQRERGTTRPCSSCMLLHGFRSALAGSSARINCVLVATKERIRMVEFVEEKKKVKRKRPATVRHRSRSYKFRLKFFASACTCCIERLLSLEKDLSSEGPGACVHLQE